MKEIIRRKCLLRYKDANATLHNIVLQLLSVKSTPITLGSMRKPRVLVGKTDWGWSSLPWDEYSGIADSE